MEVKFRKLSPLTEASYYILLSLITPMHGYGIMKNVEVMSGGRVKLAAGTLYGAITTLQRNKLVEPAGEDTANRRRKLYRLTDLGVELLRYEIKRLQEMVDNGLNQLGGRS